MSTDEIEARLRRLSPPKRAALEQLLRRSPTAEPELSLVERELMRIWREVLRADQVGVHDSFFALGGDSISSLQISARLAAAGYRVTSRQVLELETIARLAGVAVPTHPPEDDDDPLGDVPLTPIQRWFFAQNFPESQHWVQIVVHELRPGLDESFVLGALRAVVAHHDVLRSRFHLRDGQWCHEVRADAPDPGFAVVDLSGLDGDAQDRELRLAMTKATRVVDLTAGPLVSAALIRRGDRGDQLLLAIHHLVVDGVSMRILTEDMDLAYARLAAGHKVDLPARTTSYRSWGAALTRLAAAPGMLGQLDYWRSVPLADATAATWHRATGQGELVDLDRNTVECSQEISIEVPATTVAELTGPPIRRAGIQPLPLLLAALLSAWQSRTGRGSLQIDLESHGREEMAAGVDVSRTVGWFTSIFPMVLAAPAARRPAEIVDAVQSTLDSVPDRGVGYGVLRYLGGPDGAALAQLPASQVSVNFLGWFDQSGPDSAFGVPVQAPAVVQDGSARRPYLLDIVVSGLGGRVIVDITYGRDFHRSADVDKFAAEFVRALGDVVRDCASRAAATARPLGGLDAEQISSIVRQVAIKR